MKVLSRVDSAVLIVISLAVAVATLMWTVASIENNRAGDVALHLPVDPSTQEPRALNLGAEARFSEASVTIPVLPDYEAALLTWSAVMNQAAVLCVVALLMLLAYRLTAPVLFAPWTAGVVGVVGALLAISGSAAQILDSTAKNRLAEQLGTIPGTPGESMVYIVDFNPAALVAGTALVLLAGVFRSGRGLQKDTEGLV